MKISIPRVRSVVGASSACLLATAILTLGAPIAAADPITDLLCNSGSAQFCRGPERPAPPLPPPSNYPPPQTYPEPAPYYKNCDEVRRAGKAPLYRGQPGYASHLDRDDDGIACE